jgi:putative ABC transport system permease protein
VTPRLPFGRAPVAEEVNAELAFHLEMTTRELMERGMTRSQAQAEAERRFGDVDLVNAECRRYGTERDRRTERAEYRSELRQDIAFAIRQLAKARAFSAIAIVTLALGIGATAAVFSALDAVVLRPLPLDHPERIVEIRPTRRGEPDAPTTAEFVALKESGVFEHAAAAILGGGTTVKIDELPEIVGAARVTSEYFAVFGERPALGRVFTAEDDRPGGPRVMVISDRLWQRRFAGDHGIVGRRITLDGESYAIIGVMPASFDYTRSTEDIWTPLAFTPEHMASGARFFRAFGRLRPNVPMEQTRTAAEVVERRAAERAPNRTIPVSEHGMILRPFVDQLVGNYGRLLITLLGAVGFELLIACTNVANLLLARGTARSKELAIRAALGAARARLVRQLLTESFVLAIVGALLGLVVAFALQRFILALSPEDVPRLELATVDWRVLAFTLLLALVSCLLFGLFPAFKAARPGLQTTLRDGERWNTGSRDRVRAFLVATEVALAITLLIGSGLLIRSAILMQRVDPGFDPRGVLTARFLLPETRYATSEQVIRLYTTLRDESARLPDVQSAALTSVVPMSGSSMLSPVRGEDQTAGAGTPTANLRLISNGYFAAMGMRLIAGRDVSAHDDANAPNVIVVNETLVKKLWPSLQPRDVLGKRVDALSKRDAPQLRTIVGVVNDVHDALDQSPPLEFYIPFEQTPPALWNYMHRSLVLVLRSTNPAADATALLKPLRRVVARVDGSLPVADNHTMSSLLKDSLQTSRMNMLLLSTLGAIALVLAMVGIYGVVSYFVNQRTHEIGIRMALGASPMQIWELVVRRGLVPIVVGLVVGLGLSVLTTRVLQGHLFGVTAHDPATLGAVATLLLLVGLVATYVPARRAMRVPPVVALNEG